MPSNALPFVPEPDPVEINWEKGRADALAAAEAAAAPFTDSYKSAINLVLRAISGLKYSK